MKLLEKKKYGMGVYECGLCGKITQKLRQNVRSGNTKSCGCLEIANRMRGTNRTHGRSNTSEYNTWMGMKARCYDPKNKRYSNYGGRGISVCEEWRHSFVEFFAYIGPKPSQKHSIERRNNNGNYEPGNVMWADSFRQANNTRAVPRFDTPKGKMSVAEAARAWGVSKYTLFSRLRRGMTLAEALAKYATAT